MTNPNGYIIQRKWYCGAKGYIIMLPSGALSYTMHCSTGAHIFADKASALSAAKKLEQEFSYPGKFRAIRPSHGAKWRDVS